MAKRQTKQTSKSKRIRPGDPGWDWDIYDPPEGWRWGFPKPYRPLPGEDLKETMIRDGYPKELIEREPWRTGHVRFMGRRNCPHNEGWWELSENYSGYVPGERTWCCKGGCGHTIPDAMYRNINKQ